jgi:hypothetical protein
MKDLAILASFFLTSLSLFLHDSSMVLALDPSNTLLEEDIVVSNPFRCTVSANDRQSCVLLKNCVWCQGTGLPGICVSEKQEQALIHKIPHVKCFTDEHYDGDNTAATALFLRGHETTSSSENSITSVSDETAPYDPKCLNAPSQGSLDDDPREICDATADMQGEMCVWCDAAGVFQLCLSNDQARRASSHLQCDLGEAKKLTD